MLSISPNHYSKSILPQNKYQPEVNKTSAHTSMRIKEYNGNEINNPEEKRLITIPKAIFFSKANTLKFGSHPSIIDKLGTYSAQELYSKQSSGMDLEDEQSRENFASIKANDTEKTALEYPDIKNEYKLDENTPAFKTNEEFIEFLKNETVKDDQGNEYLRFSDDEIQILTNIDTQEEREAVKFLVGLKNGDEPRFDGYDINTLRDKALTQKGRDAIEYLTKFKNGDNPRFDLYNIEELVETAQTQKGREAIEYIAGFKDGDKPRFDGFYFDKCLVNIAKTQEGKKAIKYLAGFKDGDKPKFDWYDITSLVNKAKTPKGRKAIEYLAKFKNSNDTIFRGENICSFVDKFQTKKGRETIEYLAGFKNGDNLLFSGDNISVLFDKAQTKEGRERIEDLAEFKDGDKPRFSGDAIITIADSGIINKQNINNIMGKVEAQHSIVRANPKKYINGEFPNSQTMLNTVDNFFDTQYANLMVLSAVYDKEAVNHLLRRRFNTAEEYMKSLKNFSSDDIQLLKDLSNSSNINGKPFMPSQKIEFIDLINAYKANNLSMDKMHKMLDAGKIDIAQLNVDLFREVLKNSGMSDKEIASTPIKKLTGWDTKFVHLLSKEIQSGSDEAFFDIIRAGNIEPDFIKYIHDENNIYGKANAQTKIKFDEMNMDYDSWVNPSKKHKVHFVSKDTNQEHLSQISAQITEDMNTLMQTPVKGFLKKQFPNFIKGDEFAIPNEYLKSKSKLEGLVKKLADTTEKGQLYKVWKRAQGNAVNPDPKLAATAKNTLTVLDHLNQRLDDISKVSDTKVTKTLDLTIKMWDRNPQKDIFQGNYSTCCIGMGNGSGFAMPHYIMNTVYNMIELVDNSSRKTVGNALCYFIKGENGKPAFIIDNIEINNSVKPSSEVGIQLRNSMVEYASKVSKDVTGNDDTPIYMSATSNDVPCDDLARHIETISFLGDIDTPYIYMDLYKRLVDKDEFTSRHELLKLK